LEDNPSTAPVQPRQLISAAQIAARVTVLGQEIAAALPSGPILAVGILRGAFIFMADLVRSMKLDVRCDFLAVRSYGAATETSGVVEITHDLRLPIAGQHVLVVEDIVDTGRTIQVLEQWAQQQGASSVRVCALLDKLEAREVAVTVDYVGSQIPNVFVVGYGLDDAGKHRELPYIGVVPSGT